MKFAIATHMHYVETNGGLNCLLNLAKMLSERGHDAKVWVPPQCRYEYENNTIHPHYIEQHEMEDDRIALYLDCTLRNPLRAKKVVRYLTYGSHWYPDYDANEIVYYHAPFCKNNPAKKILTPLHWPTCLGNKGLPRTNDACYIVKKGSHYPEIRSAFSNPDTVSKINGIDIGQKSHGELVDIFNTTKYFYCYDPCCFLVIMALMCGCIVIQHPIRGCSAEEWKYTIGLQGLNGIAYGYDNLAHAEATIGDAYDDCMKLKQQTETSVDNFVNDMETGNYTFEPCYKFNESPYSLQHLDR